jgi:hypothetical protein
MEETLQNEDVGKLQNSGQLLNRQSTYLTQYNNPQLQNLGP